MLLVVLYATSQYAMLSPVSYFNLFCLAFKGYANFGQNTYAYPNPGVST